MVEVDGGSEAFPRKEDPLELHHFYEYHPYTDPADLDAEKAQENADVVEGELESLASILTEQEYRKVEVLEEALAASARENL